MDDLSHVHSAASGINTAPVRSLPTWVAAAVLLGALLMATGAVLAVVRPSLLTGSAAPLDGASRIFAGYLFSRNLAVSALLLLSLLLRAHKALGTLLLLTAAMQGIDAFVDSFEGRWPIVPGVLLLGILFLFAAGRAAGHPVWHGRFWRERKT